MKQRLEYIDLLRGLSIFLVVWYHTMVLYSPEGTNQIGVAFSSFRMSMLFFISGYINSVVYKPETLNIKRYLSKKVETIILPFIIWTFLTSYLNGGFTNISLEKLWFYPNQGFWFLPLLFIFFGIYAVKNGILRRIHGNDKLNIVIICAFVILFIVSGGVMGEYHLIKYGVYLAAFFFGELLWRNESMKNKVLANISFGTSAILLCMVWQFYPLATGGNKLYSVLNLLMDFMCSLFACVFFYNFFIKVQLPRFLYMALSEVGKNSILVYLIAIVLIPSSFQLPATWTFAGINLTLLAVAIANTALRYTIGKFIYQVPVLRYILFGKR